MSLKNGFWKKAGRIMWPQIIAIMALGLGFSLVTRSLAESPTSGLPAEPSSPLGERRFIGLPSVNTFGIQNLPGATAQVTVTAALSNGTSLDPVFADIPPESVRFFSPEADLARISSDQRIFGANFELSEQGNDAYLGQDWTIISPNLLSSAPNSPCGFNTYCLLLPRVMKLKDGWTAAFTVFNPAADEANVVIEFIDQSGSPGGSLFPVIPVGGSQVFDLADMAGIDDGFIGSAAINSDQEVAVASVRIYHEARGLRSAYPGIHEVDDKLIAPALFNNKDGQTSQICVQNAGDNTDNVILNYSDGLSAATAIDPGVSHCFDQGTEGHAAGWQGGAIISGSAGLAAIVDVTATKNNAPTGRWSYTAPIQRAISGTIAFPLIFTHFEGNGGEWNSEVYLYNFGALESVVTPRYSFTPDDFVYCSEPFTIPAGQVRSLSLAELPPLFGPGMAYFTSTQPVAAASSATDKNADLSGRDRHFGYGAAYPEGPVTLPDSCDSFQTLFLPAVTRANP